MTEHGPAAGNGGRRRKRFLSPSEKHEIWLGLVRGESTIMEAADRTGVVRSKLAWTAATSLDVAPTGRPPHRA